MTPVIPQATESHTRAPGSSPSIGQDKSDTQIGNMLPSVSTSDAGRRVSAKKKPARLKLPDMLRSQRVFGRQKTNVAPLARTKSAAKIRARAARVNAITCQGNVVLRP